MYKYKFTKQVEKFLLNQDKKFLITFYEKIKILTENPIDNILDIKPLR
jgi:mRNA-degrading endonuclease RelE of RelBE toxin-antitoxin system